MFAVHKDGEAMLRTSQLDLQQSKPATFLAENDKDNHLLLPVYASFLTIHYPTFVLKLV